MPEGEGQGLRGRKRIGSAIPARRAEQVGYGISQKKRKRIEEVFGWMKTVALLRRTRYRGRERSHLRGSGLQPSPNAQAAGAARLTAEEPRNRPSWRPSTALAPRLI